MSRAKVHGATYTPRDLSDFVARQMIESWLPSSKGPNPRRLRVLDPAVGDGTLLISLLGELHSRFQIAIDVFGFDTDAAAIAEAESRIRAGYPQARPFFSHGSFLDFYLESCGELDQPLLRREDSLERFHLIITNPPYVRTQVMGAPKARRLARQFGLSGRVDLYHAFVLALADLLDCDGVAGIIISNRFMTTRSGAEVRRALLERVHLSQVWDLGDTRLFDAAVLPAVLLATGTRPPLEPTTKFTSIYTTNDLAVHRAATPLEALQRDGVVEIDDGRKFLVRHGTLDPAGSEGKVWRISNQETSEWLRVVKSHTWRVFGDIGKIRVGVKTCADSVFIRSDWDRMPPEQRPELLRPLHTHHVARSFRARPPEGGARQILYPHEVVRGKRQAIDLPRYPRSMDYLERHRVTLASRNYVLEAGRNWYEIWVPQDPEAWPRRKLVFRDIAETPTFWIDEEGAVVNGDCYWMTADNPADDELLWLALAVANSRFTEMFYDQSFHNKLYAGRRRFITQYVELFPLPDPATPISQGLVAMARRLHGNPESRSSAHLRAQIDSDVFVAFGLSGKEVAR